MGNGVRLTAFTEFSKENTDDTIFPPSNLYLSTQRMGPF
jgi:hypothetical protein